MRLIDLSLDQLSTNSLLCGLRYDSPPCPSSSSSDFLRLPSFSESVPRIYREREKEQYKKRRTEQKMRKSQSNTKKEGNTVEKK